VCRPSGLRAAADWPPNEWRMDGEWIELVGSRERPLAAGPNGLGLQWGGSGHAIWPLSTGLSFVQKEKGGRGASWRVRFALSPIWLAGWLAGWLELRNGGRAKGEKVGKVRPVFPQDTAGHMPTASLRLV